MRYSYRPFALNWFNFGSNEHGSNRVPGRWIDEKSLWTKGRVTALVLQFIPGNEKSEYGACDGDVYFPS